MGGRGTESASHLGSLICALLVAHVASAGYDVVTQTAPVYGTKLLVRRVYGDVVAVVVLIPAALLFDRHNIRRLSWRVVGQLFLLGLIGVFGSQMLFFFGTERASAELTSAMQPSVSVFTALIALLFGVEKVNLRRRDSRAKLAGVTLCCAGAFLMLFYRGPAVLGWSNLGGDVPNVTATATASQGSLLERSDWKVGAACLGGSALCTAVFILLQVPVLKQYPAPVSVIAFSYLFGTMLMGAASFFFLVPDFSASAWLVAWNFDLILILYNGIISSALHFGLVAWVLLKAGPLFVASFILVQAVASTVLALIVLRNLLYLGSVLGTGLIILGLVLVCWAGQESMRLRTLARIVEQSGRAPRVSAEPANTPELNAPLLQV